MENVEKLIQIVSPFNINGKVSDVRPLGNGLINDTYKVTTQETDAPDYVLQRINNAVFQNVELLQNNIEAVTRHIRKKLEARGEKDIERKVLQFIETTEGKTYYQDDAGRYWRLSVYIPRSKTYETVNAETSYQVGLHFGDFENMLTDIPETLGATIPDFHNLEFRLKQLQEVLQVDTFDRAGEAPVKRLLDIIDRDRYEMSKGERMLREGVIPRRICHCDTKVNNMMFDEKGDFLLVIDLDTVMPSFVFSDYGDFLRSAANTTFEDDPDMSHIDFNMDIYNAFTEGYLEGTKTFLMKEERENLPYAAALFPFMQSVRFLWDYISGDHYWKCKYPAHNLDRARNQMRLYQIAREKLL